MAFCSNCGSKIDESSRFCVVCGGELRPVIPAQPDIPAATPDARSNGLVPCADGIYRWYYELNMFKNPTVLLTLLKVFGGIFVGIYLLVLFVSMGNYDFDFGKLTGTFSLIIGGFLVLVLVSYFLYAAIVLGSKYCVLFEMDRKSVTHTQLAKQFQKAQVTATLTTLLGATRGSLSVTASGLLAGSRDSMTTKFGIVSCVKVKRHRNVIYLKGGFSWNQIYVRTEDFDTVLSYILSRVPETVKRTGI